MLHTMELKGLISGNKQFEELSYDEDIPMLDEKISKQYGAINFIGRLLNQIILITNPREIVFVESTLGFYDSNGRDILILKTIGLILKCRGVSGLNRIDILLSQHLSKTVKDIVKTLKTELNQENRNIIDTLIKQVRLFTNYDQNYDKISYFQNPLSSLIDWIIYQFKKANLLGFINEGKSRINQIISMFRNLKIYHQWSLMLKLKWKITCFLIQQNYFIRLDYVIQQEKYMLYEKFMNILH